MKSEGLTSSNEPIGIEQEQVKSTSVLSKKKKSGKKRIKFTKEEDDAIRDGVRVFGEGDWKSIKTYHANVLNRRDNVAIKDRWRNIQLALNRKTIMRGLSWRDNNCAIKCMISVVKLCKASKI